MSQEWVVFTKAKLAHNLYSGCLWLSALKIHRPFFGLDFFGPFKRSQEIQVPIAASKFAIGKIMIACLFQVFHKSADSLVLYLCKLFCCKLTSLKLTACIAHIARTQKTTYIIIMILQLCHIYSSQSFINLNLIAKKL